MILVAEDEQAFLHTICHHLSQAGYQVVTAADGPRALQLLDDVKPKLIVLDRELPKLDGLEVMRAVRERADVPIILTSSEDSAVDRIAALEMGADDFMVHPFNPTELVCRVRAVLRRSQAGSERLLDVPKIEAQPLVFGPLTIDPSARTVAVKGVRRPLTAREFDLLLVLARQPRRVFTRQELLALVWGFSDYIDPSTVTVHMRRLRGKIEEDASSPKHLLTARGVGYSFEP